LDKRIFGAGLAVSGGRGRYLVACLLSCLAGCSAIPGAVATQEGSRESVVMERSQSRWDALLKGRLAEAYQFYSPTTRTILSYEDFVRSVKQGFWKGAKVERAECKAEEACEVAVTIEYTYAGTAIRTPIRETWIHVDGNWWYAQKG
jgi:hypothetical protein